jgi:hypothetical protein
MGLERIVWKQRRPTKAPRTGRRQQTTTLKFMRGEFERIAHVMRKRIKVTWEKSSPVSRKLDCSCSLGRLTASGGRALRRHWRVENETHSRTQSDVRPPLSTPPCHPYLGSSRQRRDPHLRKRPLPSGCPPRGPGLLADIQLRRRVANRKANGARSGLCFRSRHARGRGASVWGFVGRRFLVA